MMKSRTKMTWVLVILSALAASCLGQGAANVRSWYGKPMQMEGQFVVVTQPSVTTAQVRDWAAAERWKVLQEIPGLRTYVLDFSSRARATVEEVVAQYKTDPRFEIVQPNYLFYPLEEPNDTLYSRQWGLPMMKMPDAWDVEKGQDDIRICIIDTGANLNHEDLKARIVASTNTGFGGGDATDTDGHGTHVAGTAAAIANNSLGVAGVNWEKSGLLIAKAGSGGFSSGALINAIQWAITNQADVINLSLGGPFRDDAVHGAIQQARSQGILFAVAMGNERQAGNPTSYPAAFEEVIAVAAVGPTGTVASYSSFGEHCDVAAPGGDGPEGSDDAIWSCWISEGGTIGTGDASYHSINGTSMASPHVAGAISILLSAGIDPDDVQDALQDTAKQPGGGTGQHNPDYGWGIVDVAAALGKAGVRVKLIQPAEGAVYDFNTPLVEGATKGVKTESVVLKVDGVDVVSLNLGNLLDHFNPSTGAFSYVTEVLSPGLHKVVLSAESQDGLKKGESSASFIISPHKQEAGLSTIGFPYNPLEGQSAFDFLAGSSYTLARWSVKEQKYVYWNSNGLPQDPNAGLEPPNARVRESGNPPTTNTPPRGLGYFIKLNTQTQIHVGASGIGTTPYEIDLATGWNLIGNPFPYFIDFQNCQVEYKGQPAISVAEAIEKRILSPAIYRYIITEGPLRGTYGPMSGTDALLYPWQAHWIHVRANTYDRPGGDEYFFPVRLIVPPVSSPGRGRAQGSGASKDDRLRLPSARQTEDDFILNLQATCGLAGDMANFIGVRKNAKDGPDKYDYAKPPMVSNYVSLIFFHSDWGEDKGAYMSDVRSRIVGEKTWEFTVTTDQTDREVTLRWPNVRELPKTLSYTLVDLDTGRRLDMRSSSHYVFNAPRDGSPRKFRLVVKQEGGSALQVQILQAESGRANGPITLTYRLTQGAEVKLSMRSLNGKLVREQLEGYQDGGLRTARIHKASRGGSSLPRGTYIVTVEARSDNGRIARALTQTIVR